MNMNENILKEEVKEIMSVVFDLDKSALRDDCGTVNLDKWDSLHHINLILALEAKYAIRFTDEEIIEMTTLPLIIYTLKEKIL